ncbi:ankyrin repeat containing protein, partial [Metarhizium majus ARSEF 297]
MAEPTSGAAQEDRRWARLEAQRKEAMRLEHEAVQELREIRNNRNLAICVGSGVTLFSTRNDDGTIRDRLTWKGLIHNGFDYLQREEPRFYSDNKKTFDSARDILDNTDSTLEDVLHAARTLTRWMETKHKFADWLSTQFERLNEYVKYPAILVSLAKLHRAGAALMTTNYDGLIEHHCQLTALDGSQSGELELFNRRKVPNVVFHPHGYWKTPKYIVLDSLQYYDVGRVDNAVRKVLEDMLRGRTVVFVGCGAGVGDPNFGQLLQWLGKQQKDVSHGHYILLRKGDDYAELEGLPLKKVHVATFDDIAKWLEDLLVDPSERSDGTGE